MVGWARQEITGYHHAVAETWQTSVIQLTEAGRHLLERLAFLAPDPVPEFLLDVTVPGADGGGCARGGGRSGDLLAGDARCRGRGVPGAPAGAGRDAARAGGGGDGDGSG